MPRFEPFRGLRYDTGRHDLAKVSSPPYDVIDPAQRARLAAEPYNAVRIDLPVDEDGENRYKVACRLLHEWQDEGDLVTDDSPTYTIYRMTFTDEAGIERQTTGVIGALELSEAEDGDVLAHEQTTKKAKSDRLDMLRSCQANLSAIWGLSLAKGLTGLLPIDSPSDDDWIDPDGVRHTVWICRDAAVNDAISAAVRDQPVVIADGHHRYATSLAYRDEHRAEHGEGTEADLTLCYVVELVSDELTVQPIHRLVNGIGDIGALPGQLSAFFDVFETHGFGPDAVERLVAAGSLGLVTKAGSYTLSPRADAFDPSVDLDTVRLQVALSSFAGAEFTYQHGVGNVTDAVATGAADAAFLMRPATVAQIQEIAHGGDRMPPKTTFFAPKPATGIVFRTF